MEKIQILRRMISDGQVKTARGRMHDDLLTLVNQIEIEHRKILDKQDITGTQLMNALLKRKSEKNGEGMPVVKQVGTPHGGSTTYIRYDSVIYGLNYQRKLKRNPNTKINS